MAKLLGKMNFKKVLIQEWKDVTDNMDSPTIKSDIY